MPRHLFLNYSNPMAMLTGYMQRYTKIGTVGLCHSVQVCSEKLLEGLDMKDKLEGRQELIAGINHMAWLLEIRDKDGNDLYPEIKNARPKRTAVKSMRIWCVMNISVIWDITVQSPASIMQSTIRSLLSPNIRK